ncbi:response regulator [Emticicia sp. BO119]|uniref:response regulator n=1 Tax=Emticicia sp. BO119 TaxID=2757768 RepID=UPI0015F0FABF|nr:response regulator [Emticicia sp. BO119]MBA4852019.1 response regulator [Emticicia sp. BO119]
MNQNDFLKEINCFLLVDDDKITNLLHTKLLKICHVQSHVEVVTSGVQAIDFLTCKGAYTSNKNFPQSGIILLDINMPVMNGWDFLDEYKKFDKITRSKFFIVMLTSSIDPSDKNKADEIEDIKMFLNKPLTKENLLSIIHNYYLYVSGMN